MTAKETDYPESCIDLNLMNRVMRHRLRNLCAGVKMTANRIADTTKETHPRMSSRCEIIVSELDNLHEFTTRLDLLFDTLPPATPKSLFDVISELRDDFVKNHPFATLDFDGPEATVSFPNGSLLQLCMGELLANAGDAAANNGNVKLSWQTGDNFSFTISNNGSKIPEEIPINPPQPFNTLRSRHDGIGLSIAYRICKALDSELFINNENTDLVTVTVQLSPEEFVNE